MTTSKVATMMHGRVIPARVNIAREALHGALESGLGGKLALLGPNGGITYAELDAQSGAFAAACAARGIARGDRVLLRTWNCIEFAVAFMGLAKLGAVPVMQNSAAGAADVEYVLGHSDAVAAVALAELAGPLRELGRMLPKGLIVARGAAPGEGVYEDMIRGAGMAIADTGADEPALMCYTSGTTGRPKGIVHAHRWIIGRGDANRLRMPHRPDDVALAAGEWSFISLLGHNVLFALRNGITGAILEERASAEKFLESIEKFRVTVAYAVPTIYRRILATEGMEKDYDLSSLRACNASGEALGAAPLAEWKRRFRTDIYEHYGISEYQMVLGQSPLLPIKPGSVGVPWDVVAEIVDDELRPMPQGEVGQLVFGTDNPSLFLGYHKDPAKTAEVVHDGWYHTGDLARRDEDGYYWISGRGDDCFKSRGIFIVPIEIENALAEHPAVAEACVVPVPSATDGYLIRAVVVLRAPLTAADGGTGGYADKLRETLKSRIARNKVPHVFEFVDTLPKSANGKVLRRSLIKA
ncbi:MAG: acyl--CoA ligase [Betaproteobacteria bacterium]|nr:acyl--CoA ligase [Betaproteobacteria bacterium]